MSHARRFLGRLILVAGFLPILANAEPVAWLKNEFIEAGFSVEKGVRLEIIRQPGGENFLRESADASNGLRVWVMTPSENLSIRDILSRNGAAIERISSEELRISTGHDNLLGIQLEWIVRLEKGSPVLEITHRFHNHGDVPHYVSIWSILSVAPEAVMGVPFSSAPGRSSNHPNFIAVYPYTNLADQRITSSRDSLKVLVREGVEAHSLKIGLVQKEGKLFIEKGDIRLCSSVAYDPGSCYPEGGSNITLFSSPANRTDTMGEAEHLSPLQELRPGKSMEMTQLLQYSN
jgi:hypothetical protein